MTAPTKLPVIVVTGFLGSGKTTLLNRLLRESPRSALLINEFGATPLDAQLIERHGISVSLLSGGCLCCQLRDTLAPTLKNLWMAWGRGRAFDRLLIETSGVASPEPVLDTLLRERWLAAHIDLQGVVATVAATAGAEQLERYAEAQAQVAWADALLLTQTDLADAGQIAELERRLDALAPTTPRRRAVLGEYDGPLFTAHTARSGGSPSAQGHAFRSFSLWLDSPVSWPALQSALESLLGRHRRRLVRIKGIVQIEGQALPVVVQGAGGRLYPATSLPARETDDRRGRLVFITDGPPDGLAEEFMDALRAVAA